MLLIKIQFIGKECEHQVPFKNLPLFKFLFPNYTNIPTNICAIHIKNSLIQHVAPVMY
jgi:hypothetical protein